MPKDRTIFRCTNCDAQFPKWTGRCAVCGQWNTLVEERFEGRGAASGKPALAVKPSLLTAVEIADTQRTSTGSPDIDQLLGGGERNAGMVAGSLVLLGGDPGIGKSTLALQWALHTANSGSATLYVSGEESLPQIKLRAERLGEGLDKLQVLSENNLDAVLATTESVKPRFAVIDSIQTMYAEGASGVAGGVAQVSYATARILELCKSRSIATLIIGHVTKEGQLAGPRMLEHMVDVVLYLEGERFLSFRILRCVKNRFGRTDEVAVFEMKENGLRPVANPSQLFLSERVASKPGNMITCTVEGTRPLLLEVQALTAHSQFSYPKRTATGFDFNRLQLIAAVLQQRLHLKLAECDIFVGVAGGFRIVETACDLAVALSIVSSLHDSASPDDMVAVGEVGLSGEVRSVGQIEKRLVEAAKLGFKRMLIPAGNKISSTKIKLLPVADLTQAMRVVFKK